MAPPSSSTSRHSNIPTELSVTDADGLPYLDGDDIHVPLFIDELDTWFSQEHATAYAFLENGFTVYKDKVIVWTAEQAKLIAEDLNTLHTFQQPHPALAKTTTKLETALEGEEQQQQLQQEQQHH